MRKRGNCCGTSEYAVAMRSLSGALVTTRRPPGCVTIRMRVSPDVFFLTDATSKLGRRSGACVCTPVATVTTPNRTHKQARFIDPNLQDLADRSKELYIT